MLGHAWIVADGNQELLATEDDLVKRILIERGMNPEEIPGFLNPSVKDCMPDPFVLRDCETAVHVIASAIYSKKKIAIYGDYDVDGITSTAICVRYLRMVGADVVWHLPTREGEGYGLNKEAIEKLHNDGVELLITVDCGISGVDEVDFAKSLGMQVVVTDHHSPDTTLPNADAIVNPKRNDDDSGLDYLAGVGVAFLVLVALNRELKNSGQEEFIQKTKFINLLNFLDCVALGTICDTMALIK